jgi:alcohol dehydrogenase class IV
VTFEFATAGRILFGPGVLAQVPAVLGDWKIARALLVTGRDPARTAALAARLEAAGVATVAFAVPGEPTVELARAGVRAVHEAGATAVVACGGGSALDAGKAIAALATNGGEPLDFLEVVGQGRPLMQPPLPLVAIPTTAGTGSEVTRNAVLTASDAGVKASLRSPSMLPLAAVDPDLLAGLPPAVIASSGLDALSQVIEPFLSARANPLSDALAREGIRRSARALARAYAHGLGQDAAARDDLAITSLCGGLCLANAGLGAVHGFAAPAGGMLGAAHGAICAALLPHVLAVNLRALRARAPQHPALPRFRELAALLTGRAEADVSSEDGIAFIAALCRTLQVPGLAGEGLTSAQIPVLVARAKEASSMRGNPVVLTDAELLEIAERAL